MGTAAIIGSLIGSAAAVAAVAAAVVSRGDAERRPAMVPTESRTPRRGPRSTG